ncbi:MAG: hypothetical protein MI757_17125 [Pirellulales bacterium]|nr:hypothetical protein [Pirellulales bacterium]
MDNAESIAAAYDHANDTAREEMRRPLTTGKHLDLLTTFAGLPCAIGNDAIGWLASMIDASSGARKWSGGIHGTSTSAQEEAYSEGMLQLGIE